MDYMFINGSAIVFVLEAGVNTTRINSPTNLNAATASDLAALWVELLSRFIHSPNVILGP